jgi:predicted nucleotidyltransferase
MSEIINEAIEISKDLDNIVFVGATALILHKIINRTTMDIDIAFASKTENVVEVLDKCGYIRSEGKKEVIRSPRGFRIDIYTSDVSDISIEKIMKTACEINRRKHQLKVACIEVLIVAKHRAPRQHDKSDLEEIIKIHHRKIDHTLLKTLCKDVTEYQSIYSYINFVKSL